MKKTITRILAFVAALVCGGAWAAVGDTITISNINKGTSRNVSNFEGDTYTICVPPSLTLPAGSVVRVSKITLGMNSSQDSAKMPKYLKIGNTFSGIVNGTGTQNQNTSFVFATNSLKQEYSFADKELDLTVGTEYVLTMCSDESGTVLTPTRWHVEQTTDAAFSVIKQSTSVTNYRIDQEFVGVVQSIPETGPKFVFKGNANSGTLEGSTWVANLLTTANEGGDVVGKMYSPLGVVNMVYTSDNGNITGSKWHPWYGATSQNAFTIAAYLNIEAVKVDANAHAVLVSLGNRDGRKIVLAKEPDGSVALIAANGGTIQNSSSMPTIDASKVAKGWHLYTFTFSTANGLTLALDNEDAIADSSEGAKVATADGFQIGSIYQGRPDAFKIPDYLGVAMVSGWTSVISDAQREILVSEYPAAVDPTSALDYDVANKKVVVPSMTFSDGAKPIGASQGTLIIPSESTINTAFLKMGNSDNQSVNFGLDLAGTLNITSSHTADIGPTTGKGSFFGHYQGHATYNITGTFSSPNAYTRLMGDIQEMTININGGTFETLALLNNAAGRVWNGSQRGVPTINLTNNGTLKLANGDLSTAGWNATINRNFGYGTYMNSSSTAMSDSRPINFTDAENGTTIDATTGDMTITGAISGSGKVITKGNVTFTGAFSGTPSFNAVSGTLSLAAGSEGTVTVAEGATLKLRVTDEQITMGYTATNVTLPDNTDIVFVNARGETVEGGRGNTLAPAAVFWTGEAADNDWNTPGNWSSGSAPTSETLVAIKKDATITLSASSQAGSVIVSADITFNGTSTAGNLKNITTVSSKTITVNSSEAVVLSGLAGGTLVKNGTGTLSVKPGTGANVAALANMNVVINNGKVMIDQPTGTEATINEVAFTIAESACGSDKVPLDCYGWFSATGPWSVETTGNARIFNNNGYESAAVIKGSGNFTKLGTGTVEVLCAIGNEDNAYSGTVTVSEGTLRINTACTATIKLTAGTIKSPNELTVEKTDANKKIVTSTETEDETTIHVWSLAQRDPTTVYATQGFNSYKLDANTVVTLVDGDTIVCNRGYMGGNNWGGGKDLSSLANKGHKIIIEHEMDLGGNVGIPAAMQVEVKYRDYSNIEDRKGVYLYGSIGENAQISGTGALFLGFGGDCTIADGVTISCDTGFQSAGKTAIINGTVTMSGKVYLNGSVIKLGTAQAKLIVNEAIADSGVQSGVENKVVKYDEATKTYSLGDLVIEPNVDETGQTSLVVDAVGAVIKTVEVDDTETETETVFSGTTIPLDTTAHYRIRAGSVTKDVGVIVAKTAEAGTTRVTTLVAVPFANLDSKALTIDSLLVKSNLSDGDEIMAWNGVYKRYDAWSMSGGSWGSSTTVTKDSDTASVPASSYDLFPGQAVWVRTAGKIVVYGTLPASDVTKVTASNGVNLLGNRAMTDATPEAQVEVKTGDFVEIPGDTKGVRQYEKTADGWKATLLPVPVMVGDKQLEIDGKKVWKTETKNVAPSVPAGRGYFLKRSEAQSTSEP